MDDVGVGVTSGIIRVNERPSALSIFEPSQEVIASKHDTTEDMLRLRMILLSFQMIFCITETRGNSVFPLVVFT